MKEYGIILQTLHDVFHRPKQTYEDFVTVQTANSLAFWGWEIQRGLQDQYFDLRMYYGSKCRSVSEYKESSQKMSLVTGRIAPSSTAGSVETGDRVDDYYLRVYPNKKVAIVATFLINNQKVTKVFDPKTYTVEACKQQPGRTIKTDADIQACAGAWRKNLFKRVFSNSCPEKANDLSDRFIPRGRENQVSLMCLDTSHFLYEFFQCSKNPKRVQCLAPSQEPKHLFRCLYDIERWCYTATRPTSRLTPERISEMMSNIPRTNKELMVYDRKEEWLCFYHKTSSIYGSESTIVETIAAHNTNTKKTYLYQRVTDYGGQWINFNMSYRTIANMLNMFSYGDGQVVWNVPFIEFIRGTNLETALQNFPDNIIISGGGCFKGYTPRSLYDRCQIRQKELTDEALFVIMYGGGLFAELALKSGYGNLFRRIIKDAERTMDRAFCDIDAGESVAANPWSKIDIYGKQTTLSKILNLSTPCIKILDEWFTNVNHDIPCLYFIEEVCGCSRKAIGPELFRKILNMRNTTTGFGSTLSQTLKLVKQVLPTSPATTRLDFIETFCDTGQTYQDYLDMKKVLQQYKREDGVLTDDEAIYPTVVKKAVRFLPATATCDTARLIDRATHYYYAPYEIVYDSQQVPIGIRVSLSPKAHLFLLHHQIIEDLRFYIRRETQVLFTEAHERLSKLEWADPETGLQIVAPKSAAELEDEGEVLAHCVGSYVPAIVNQGDNVFFLRRMDMPQAPYYTVELYNKQIRQVHCYHNGDLSPTGQQNAYQRSKYEVYNRIFNIKDFLTKWAAKFPEQIDAQSIHQCYGALCAPM